MGVLWPQLSKVLKLVHWAGSVAEINVGDADLEEVNRRIVSSILEATREAIPVTSGGLSRSNSNPWWNKECEEAVRLKRVMYRHYSKDQNAETHERMKAANRDCNKIIAQAKKDHWIAFTDSISAGKADLGSVWKKIRRMKQQCVVPDSDLQHGSTKYTTAQSKADALAKAFAEASDTDSLHLTGNNSNEIWWLPSCTRCQMTVWRLTPH